MKHRARLFRPPPQGVPSAPWHVSPGVDIIAYAFSWLLVLAPIALVGDDMRVEFLWAYLLTMCVTDAHRHYSLPYIYLDSQVFRRHTLRFVLFPIALFALFIASPWAARGQFVSVSGMLAVFAGFAFLLQILGTDSEQERPSIAHLANVVAPVLGGVGLINLVWPSLDLYGRGLVWLAATLIASLTFEVARRRRCAEAGGRPRVVLPLAIAALLGTAAYFPDLQMSAKSGLNAAAVIAAVWGIWHVFMQKYGILRLYNAKSGRERKVPGWVDRLLIWSWLPLYLAYLGPRYQGFLFQKFRRGKEILTPIVEAIEVVQEFLLVPSIALVIVALALFLVHERRANGLRNAPRLWMGAGLTLLGASFLLVHPFKAYIAYTFSHAVEYMVFVWAFQRRRYSEPLAHKPAITRFLRYPLFIYVGTVIICSVALLYFKYSGTGRYLFREMQRPEIFDIGTYEWLRYWVVYQSFMHFYYDGFLWKMRLPSVRASI